MQAFRSFVAAQPHDVPFVFAYKGKYIVQVEKSTVGSAHVNAYYYVDGSQNLVDHDFEAGVPAAGQLTIEKTSHITPGSTAAFATELRAFLQSVGLASINLQGGRAFNWYDATAAYYEAPIPTVTVEDEDGQTVVLVGRGPDFENGDGDLLISFRSNQDKNYLVFMGEELNYMTVNGGMTDVGPVSEDYESVIPIINCSNGSAETPADNYKLIFWAKDNNLWSVAAVHGIDIYDTNDPGVVGQIDTVQVISGKKVISCFQDDYFILQEDEWLADTGELLLDGNGAFTIPFESGQFTDVYGCNSVNSSNLEDRMKCYNGMMFYLAGVITQTPTGFPI